LENDFPSPLTPLPLPVVMGEGDLRKAFGNYLRSYFPSLLVPFLFPAVIGGKKIRLYLIGNM